MQSTNNFKGTEIAITGIGCRFPGAADHWQFWENLRSGVESVSRFSPGELAKAGIPEPEYRHPDYVPVKAVIEGADHFDAAFFGFSPREAALLDPQQRLFLQCCWQALEDGGLDPEAYDGLTGVYAGMGLNSYLLQNLWPNKESVLADGAYSLITGNDKDFLPTRVAYKLNLRGPAVNVQTACSTSLVAVHIACQALLNMECDAALAGGVSISLPLKHGYLYQEDMILSPDGHCRPFDHKGKGTISGDGAGVVLLKRLEVAVQDGDPIYAVILGSAINNDGREKVAYTAPSVDGQASVISDAQVMAEVEPADISYIEAHGTATKLGDPIEIAGLKTAFGTGLASGSIALGALKSNIGHLDSAAGIAGLIKTALSLYHKTLLPTLHFEAPNPETGLADSPFYVNQALKPWEANGGPRRAGVSSFGIGGTNAHAVLEEWDAAPVNGIVHPLPALVCLSANDRETLERMQQGLAAWMNNPGRSGQNGPEQLQELSWNLQTSRKDFPFRGIAVANTWEHAGGKLSGALPGWEQRKATAQPARVAFLFPGQGTQYPNMGRGLYEHIPVFRRAFDACADLFLSLMGEDIRKLIFPAAGEAAAAADKLKQTKWTQPAVFATAYATALMWMAWGIKPVALLGQSIGEYVAACISGMISLKQGVEIVAQRATLMEAAPEGAMLSVQASAEAVRALLPEGLEISGYNGPELIIVGGSAPLIEDFSERLSANGIEFRRLRVSHAFHTAMVAGQAAPLVQYLKGKEFHPARIPVLSNYSGTWFPEGIAPEPAYWGQHLRSPIQLNQNLETLFEAEADILLECGPGRNMVALATRHPDKPADLMAYNSLPGSKDTMPDLEFVMQALGRLWTSGAEVDWKTFWGAHDGKRIHFPTYPFLGKRLWIDPPMESSNGGGAVRERVDDRVERADFEDWFYLPGWKRADHVAPQRAELADRPVLLFENGGPLSDHLAERLLASGRRVVRVKAGTGFEMEGPDRYTVSVAVVDFRRLLVAIGTGPWQVIFGWAVADYSSWSHGELQAHASRCFQSLVFLAQAFGAEARENEIEFRVLLSSHFNVIGQQEPFPGFAPLVSAVRLLPLEYEFIGTQLIDMQEGTEVTPQSDLLLSAFNGKIKEKVVAYRSGMRWTESFDRIDSRDTPEIELQEGGVYLLPGGRGQVGAGLAEGLASKGRCTLVIAGRSALPPVREWGQNQDERLQRFARLVEQGHEVAYVQADITSQEETDQLFETVMSRYGRLDGVIQCALSRESGLVSMQTETSLAEELAPKVSGSMHVVAAAMHHQADFVLFTSSLNSYMPSVGQLTYSAGNSFQDELAQAGSEHVHSMRSPADKNDTQSSGHPTRLISLNFDGWVGTDFFIDERLSESLQDLRRKGAEEGLHAEEGAKVMLRALSLPYPQLLISIRSPESRFSEIRTMSEMIREQEEAGQEENGAAQTEDQTGAERPELGTPYRAPENETQRNIAAIWGKYLGIREIGIHDNFFELGGHSLMATQVLARIRDQLNVQLNLDQLFANPTVSGLAGLMIQPVQIPVPVGGPEEDEEEGEI